MAKIRQMHEIVLGILEEYPETRDDDFKLYGQVCAKLGKDLNMEIWRFFACHALYNFPSFENVTRCRRRIQEKFPDLCSPEMKIIRGEEEKEYKEYARG